MSARKGRAFKLFSIAVGLLVLFVGALWTMRSTFIAQAEREGSVAQLIARVECETCPLDERKRAVWALGQSGYARDASAAVPVLEKHLVSIPKCDHARKLCRYELKKAILQIQGKWDLRASLFTARDQ